MTVDKVTISSQFGEDLTVEEYEEALRGDLVAKDVKEMYPRLSGEFARTLHRGYKAKWQDPITKAVSGRYHSPEEIRKENEEMASRTAAIRKQVLHNMLRNAGSWVEPTSYLKGTGLDIKNTSSRATLSSAVSQLWPFLEATGNMQRRQSLQGRGFVYLYDGEAAKNPDAIIDKLHADYLAWERDRMAKKRAAARGEEPKLSDDAFQKKAEEEAKAQSVAAGIPVPGELKQFLELAGNGNGLRVKVDVNFNIRFGLIKE